MRFRQRATYVGMLLLVLSLACNRFNDRDCGDFPTWRTAQDFYLSEGGPDKDRHNLDADRDGVACESLPGAPRH
ncbi:MAG: excalibur calcium-binding domain-containing protein [Chloroflexi bacterium]|nr:excalibur calcium-binding domain-containing protein [Chloroflexota bacterium]